MVNEITTISWDNITIPQYRDMPVQYVTEARHGISMFEIILVGALFIFLAYWLIRVSKNKEYYSKWKNPSGTEINLYKKVRIFFWLYTGAVIILGVLQIILTSGLR